MKFTYQNQELDVYIEDHIIEVYRDGEDITHIVDRLAGMQPAYTDIYCQIEQAWNQF